MACSIVRRARIHALLAVLAMLVGLEARAHAGGDRLANHGSAAIGAAAAREPGWFGKNRPDSDTAARAMADLRCPCGCDRQSILECDCRTAADLRHRVMDLLAATDASGKHLADLSTPAGRDAAYAAVLASFEQEFGKPAITMASDESPWILQALAAIGALSLVIVFGRRWIARPHAAAAVGPEDADAKARLDAELRGSD